MSKHRKAKKSQELKTNSANSSNFQGQIKQSPIQTDSFSKDLNDTTGCSPSCPFFPREEEVKWHIGEDGLKHRDNPTIHCGYDGSVITTWQKSCQWKIDRKLLTESANSDTTSSSEEKK